MAILRSATSMLVLRPLRHRANACIGKTGVYNRVLERLARLLRIERIQHPEETNHVALGEASESCPQACRAAALPRRLELCQYRPICKRQARSFITGH